MFPRSLAPRARSLVSPLLACVLAPVALAAVAACGAPEPVGTGDQGATLLPTRQKLSGYLTTAITGTKLVGPVPARTVLHLAIGLPLRNAAAFEAKLAQVSDPASTAYRQYLTPQQIAATYAPTAVDYRTLTAFATANGLTVTGTYSNRLVLDVSGPASAIESAFGVLLNYRLRPDGTEFYALDREPSVALSVPLLHVTGLDNLVVPHALGGAAPNGLYGSSDVRTAYASCSGLTGTGQSVGLFELDGYNASDVAKYESLLGLPSVPLVNVLIDGATGVPAGDDVEAVADVELAIAMAPGLSSVVVFEAPYSPAVAVQTAYANDILNQMATHMPLVLQLSSSYTFQMDAMTQAILDTMAMQGQSFFQSSGDGGSYLANTQWNINEANVTLVGGTTLTMNGAGASYGSEVAWASDGEESGGGVECCEPNVAIPTYQQGIDMTANHGSTTSRNSPDVSMVAQLLFIVGTDPTPGGWFKFHGTSAAAPLWAGFMALINERNAQHGLPPTGFANPALYAIAKKPGAYASTFNDVTSGTNGAFNAVAGYDLVTGLGTPKCGLIDQMACVTCGGSTCVSEQTDPNNCGTCGNVCPGGACLNGLCETVATGSANDLAVDGANVYWTSWTAGTVSKAPVGGGPAATLATGQSMGGGFAIDASNVYWGHLGSVNDVAIAGGTVGTVASAILNGPLDLAADWAGVFWMSNGTKETLCQSPVTELAAGSSTPRNLTTSCGGVRIATDGTNVYWTTQGSPIGGPSGTPMYVMQTGLAGGTPIQLASGGAPSAIAVYAGNVYWTDGASVKSVPVGGGTSHVLTAAAGTPRSIAVDASGVYWTSTASPAAVLSMPLAGGSPTTLATSTSPDGIAVTSNRVYWADHVAGVQQLAK